MNINPITRLDYPDPDVIRVGEFYYMVSTTMYFFPGGEILRSRDLVHWEHLSYIYDSLDDTPGQRLEGTENIYGQGMWAACIRFHQGLFYVCFVANDTGKAYLYTASDPAGPWQRRPIQGFYHDCSLLFDQDGRVYISYGNRDIRITELKEDLSGPKLGGLDRVAVSDRGNPNLGYEGSHLYCINEKYYLFLIHSRRDRWRRTQACFTADSLEGEFTGGDVLDDDMGYWDQGVAQGGPGRHCGYAGGPLVRCALPGPRSGGAHPRFGAHALGKRLSRFGGERPYPRKFPGAGDSSGCAACVQ